MIVTIDSVRLSAAVKRVAQGTAEAAAELNAADGQLGDGDLGITVSKGFAEAAEAACPDDVGMVFIEYAKAFQRVSSSSYGTLVATGFMSAAKLSKGKTAIEPDDIPALVAAARDGMMARGKGNLGDKTVLDTLDGLARDLIDTRAEDMLAKAVASVEATMSAFHGKPCKLGRARMFEEKSAALDDPGQLALLRIVQSLA